MNLKKDEETPIERAARKGSDFIALKQDLSERYLGVPKRGKRIRETHIPEKLRQNLIGIAISEKRTGRSYCGIPAVTFFVKRKIRKEELTKSLILPRKIDGIVCDVIACGSLRPATGNFSPYDPNSPLGPGCQIGVLNGSPGTLGGFMVDDRGDTCLISNCHVLSPFDLSSSAQLNVYQPGNGYNGSRQVARVTHVIPLSSAHVNRVDLAVARIDEGILIDPSIPGFGSVSGMGQLSPCDNVTKLGAGTLETYGDFRAIAGDIRIRINGSNYLFTGVQGFRPSGFIGPGDSGSMVTSVEDRKLVSMVLGESAAMNFGFPVQAIENALPGYTWIL